MLDVSVYFDTEVPPIQSFKNALQEWCADKKHRLPAPIYKTVAESGPDHKRIYERAVIIGDRTVAVGKGKNLKIADSAAAETALEILKKEESSSNIKTDAVAKLKEFSAKNKKPSPEFRDLGESPASKEGAREFVVECRSMGQSAVARGKSKQEARALSAEAVLTLLSQDEKKQNAKHPTKKKVNFQQAKKVVKETKERKASKNVTRSSSPKKQPHQHKKHL